MAEDVKWWQLEKALDMEFLVTTGRGLSSDALLYFCKFFGNSIFFLKFIDFFILADGKLFRAERYNREQLISRSKFCKTNLDDQNFSFCDWIHSVLRLIRDHLRSFWYDGLIAGFISKEKAEQTLQGCSVGTFLLRITDSQVNVSVKKDEMVKENHAALSIVVKTSETNFGHSDPKKCSYAELSKNTLGDLLYGFEQCVHLYPRIPKVEAFRRSSSTCKFARY